MSRCRRPERLHPPAPEAGRRPRPRRPARPRCRRRRGDAPRAARDRPASADRARRGQRRCPRARCRRNTSAPRRRRLAAGRARARRSSTRARSHRRRAARPGSPARSRPRGPPPPERSPASSTDRLDLIGPLRGREFPRPIPQWRSRRAPTAGRAQGTSTCSVFISGRRPSASRRNFLQMICVNRNLCLRM